MHDPNVASDAAEAGAIYSETADRYVDAIGTELSVTVDGSAELSALDDFVALVRGGPVADIGCGPGRAAAYLAARSVEVAGFDIAPGMIAAAQAAHPHIQFEVGTLTALPVDDQCFAGAVCWYSIIHTPPDELSPVWIELRRVLRPSAPLLLAFQVGDGERVERPRAAGTERTLVNHRHDPDDLADSLRAAGFEIDSIQQRPAVAAHENTPQAIVLARASEVAVGGLQRGDGSDHQ